MSTAVDYRRLPPVEPVDAPSRFSQTLIAKHDDCPRSAYLYLKHRGGPGSHRMDRGTLAHMVLERALKTLMAHGAKSFVEPGVRRHFRPAGVDRGVPVPEVDALVPDTPEPGEVAAIMAGFVDEVLRERLDLVGPRREVDDVREMAYHWAVGYDVDPEHVAGFEQLMVLDLECGWTISGKLDVIALPSAELGQVDDYKSGQAMPSQEEYEGKVQPWVYAVLLCFGTPVTVTPCEACAEQRAYPAYFVETDVDLTGVDLSTPSMLLPAGVTRIEPVPLDCEVCGGKGQIETRGEPGALGGHLKGVLTREVYPRPKLRDDGTLHRRELLLSRTAIADYRADLERMAWTLGERLRTWEFPARAGSWCSECPAAQECPLPGHLRDFAGTINSVEQAEESWEKVQREKARIAAIEREVKNFAKAHAVPIRVGDEQWEWQPSEGRALKKIGRGAAWDELAAAVQEAAEYGTPFDVTQWVLPTVSNGFKKSKVVKEAGE